jgi:hypothetical protein
VTAARTPRIRTWPRRTPRWVGAIAGLALAALALAGCAVEPGAGPAATTRVVPSAPSPIATATPLDPALIQPIVVSTSLWPGRGTLLLTLEDAANAPFGGPAIAVRVRIGAGAGVDAAHPAGTGAVPDVGATPDAGVEAQYVRLSRDGRSLYEVAVDLPAVGRWPVVVVATAGARTWHGSTSVDVLDPGRTPAIGSVAPAVDTPTSASAGGDLAKVTSDPIPDKRLYWLSVRGALDARKAFVLVVDSFAFRTSPSCGGALGIVRHLVDEFPTIAFIHVEPYATTSTSGRLALDPPGGPPRPAAWSRAWGVSEAPWVFVVDADGVVRAKFSGVVGTDELRAAIRSVATWAPTY